MRRRLRGIVLKDACMHGLLQRVRNRIVSVKIDYRGWEETRDYALKAENLELAELCNVRMKQGLEDIRSLERQVARLESVCFVGKK